MQALALEAGQETHHIEEKVQDESKKRRQDDEDMSRLYDELKRKTEELEAVKVHHTKALNILRKLLMTL